MSGWSLAIAAPNRELAVARALSRWQFDNHVFKLQKRIAFRGTTTERLVPAFPSYVFLKARDAWDTLRERFGIIGWVHPDLPEHILPSLLAVAGPDDVLPMPDLPARFELGDHVHILGASLIAGQNAVFQHLVSESEAIVLLDWMGRWVPVAVDERDLVGEEKFVFPLRRKRRRRFFGIEENRLLPAAFAG